jgi:predicted nuclease with TOPRIM domain
MDEYGNFRNCIIREKKIFRSMVGDVDLKKNPTAITDYLEKHFKQKEAMKKQKQMMGGDEDELRQRIKKIEEENQMVQKKKIDTMEFKSKREIVMGADGRNTEEKYI